MAKIVGIRFKNTAKVYYFAPGEETFKKGDGVIVETARGVEFGTVSIEVKEVEDSEIVQPLKPIIRKANKEDLARRARNEEKEPEALRIFAEKIKARDIKDMKPISAEYTFDGSKIIFYFTSPGRVDFRELVKDLASVFRVRIELRQIGIRDETKFMGGLGICGRPFCCSTFLPDFCQVSIKMAKEQNLSLNSSKISGACGRLMCCLRFEHDAYVQEIKLTPPVGSSVKTADGVGDVVEISPITGNIKVKINDNVRTYHRDNVKILSRSRQEKNEDEE